MRHKFTVIIESNNDTEDRKNVKECLHDWLKLNCEQKKTLFGYPDWKSVEVE